MTFLIIFAVFIIALVVYIIVAGRKQAAARGQVLADFAARRQLIINPTPQTPVKQLAIYAKNYGLSVRDELTDGQGLVIDFVRAIVPGDKNTTEDDYILGSRPSNNQATFDLVLNGSQINFDTEGLQPLQLEGNDLNAIYKLYVKPGDEVGALQTLSPDKLLWLVQNAPTAQLIGRPQALYVIVPDQSSYKADPISPTSFDSYYDYLQRIAAELAKP